MFGIGAAVVASIHLSYDKPKVVRINVTQALIVSSLLVHCLCSSNLVKSS